MYNLKLLINNSIHPEMACLILSRQISLNKILGHDLSLEKEIRKLIRLIFDPVLFEMSIRKFYLKNYTKVNFFEAIFLPILAEVLNLSLYSSFTKSLAMILYKILKMNFKNLRKFYIYISTNYNYIATV